MTRINFSVIIAITRDISNNFVGISMEGHKTRGRVTSLMDKIQRVFKLQLITLMQTQGIKDQICSLQNNLSNLSGS